MLGLRCAESVEFQVARPPTRILKKNYKKKFSREDFLRFCIKINAMLFFEPAALQCMLLLLSSSACCF